MAVTSRRLALGALLVAALIAVGVLAAQVFGSGDGDDGERVGGDTAASDGTSSTRDSVASSTTVGEEDDPDQGPASFGDGPPTVPVDGLDADARALAEAINQANTMTYHARYEGTGTTGNGDANEVIVELWRRLPLARRDLTIIGAGQRIDSREYRTESGGIGCLDNSLAGSGDFRCTEAPAGAADPAAATFGAIDPTSGSVSATDDTVDGVAVRCFQVEVDTETRPEVCFDGQGVPMVVDDGDGLRVVRTVLDDEISDDDLAPLPVE